MLAVVVHRVHVSLAALLESHILEKRWDGLHQFLPRRCLEKGIPVVWLHKVSFRSCHRYAKNRQHVNSFLDSLILLVKIQHCHALSCVGTDIETWHYWPLQP